MKQTIANWLYGSLAAGDRHERYPPGDNLRYQFGEMDDGKPMHTAVTGNDGYEIWLCYTHFGEWDAHYRQPAALQLAKFILWDWWVRATWCGLRRKIWYWALHEKLKARALHEKLKARGMV